MLKQNPFAWKYRSGSCPSLATPDQKTTLLSPDLPPILLYNLYTLCSLTLPMCALLHCLTHSRSITSLLTPPCPPKTEGIATSSKLPQHNINPWINLYNDYTTTLSVILAKNTSHFIPFLLFIYPPKPI